MITLFNVATIHAYLYLNSLFTHLVLTIGLHNLDKYKNIKRTTHLAIYAYQKWLSDKER